MRRGATIIEKCSQRFLVVGVGVVLFVRVFADS